MQDWNKTIIELARAYRASTGRAESTVSRLASGDETTFKRIREECVVTKEEAHRIIGWFSANWPGWWPEAPRRASQRTAGIARREIGELYVELETRGEWPAAIHRPAHRSELDLDLDTNNIHPQFPAMTGYILTKWRAALTDMEFARELKRRNLTQAQAKEAIAIYQLVMAAPTVELRDVLGGLTRERLSVLTAVAPARVIAAVHEGRIDLDAAQTMTVTELRTVVCALGASAQ